MVLSIFFSQEAVSCEEKEIPCHSLSDAIRKSFIELSKKSPGSLQEIRPLHKNENGTVVAAFSSKPSPEAIISVYRCGLDKSSAYDKVVGFEYKRSGMPDNYIQYRLDWDAKKGGHINLQLGQGERKEKFAFTIKEGGRKDGAHLTSENDFRSHIRRLDRSDRSARDVVSILMGLSNLKHGHINHLRTPQNKYLEEEIARQGDPDPYEQSGQWAENNGEVQAEEEGT